MEFYVSNGWIKLYRELLDKPIWKLSTPEQKSILITLLLLASHEPNEWEWKGEKFIVRSGQFVTSLDSLAEKTGLGISVQNVRTCIHRFKKLGFLTNKSTKCGRLISIINWDTYQPETKTPNKDTGKGVTKTQHMSNTYQECKNERMKEKVLKPIVETSAEVRLSELLFSLMLQNNPKAKRPNIKTWAKHIDRLIRLDKRSPEEIEQVIRWSQQDSFWLVNILSTGKLRDKFDKLWLKANIVRPQTEAEKKERLFRAYIQDEAQNEKSNSRPRDVIDIENSTETINPSIGAFPGGRTDN